MSCGPCEERRKALLAAAKNVIAVVDKAVMGERNINKQMRDLRTASEDEEANEND